MGTSVAGKRAITSMKHVGLNVAADPFMNSALIKINGGVVVAVADDPGMHSSQNEQDSRYYADFSHILCLEPVNQQEAYEMTKDAFDLSEKYQIPVMIRLVTRLAHSRAVVKVGEVRKENALKKSQVSFTGWNLLPPNARKMWSELLQTQEDLVKWSDQSSYNQLSINKNNKDLGVITTGIARNYYLENESDFKDKPSHLHISAYPIPIEKIRELAKHVKKVIVIEEGYPYVEKKLKGLIEPTLEIMGKCNKRVPPTGELNPDIVRSVLGLEKRKIQELTNFELPKRPPQLCKGCPHADSYEALNAAIKGYDNSLVTSDIGCYTLGALPPYSAIETCVCMGASVGMAKGAAEAGLHPVVAVLGDSTFLHSGVTPLMDAVRNNANMTLMILDNDIVAMTGAQPTVLTSDKLETIVAGVGINPEHFHVLTAHKRELDKNTEILKRELEYKGTSVFIMKRECIEVLKKKKKG